MYRQQITLLCHSLSLANPLLHAHTHTHTTRSGLAPCSRPIAPPASAHLLAMRAYRTVGPDRTVPWLPSSHHSRVLLACAPEACANVSADYTGPHTGPYTVGTQVRIAGLENVTHLNGRVGWVTQFDEERGIVHVAFHSRDACHSSQGPPLKLLARFVEHSVASEYADASAEQHTSLPACVSASRLHRHGRLQGAMLTVHPERGVRDRSRDNDVHGASLQWNFKR